MRVETASQNAARETDEINQDFLGYLRIILLVFGGVVTVVAAFLIFNTFSITVAQRIREFGLLRTLGASRRQILWSVVGESLAIAAVGSLAGLVGGLGAAVGLRALFKAIGIDLPSSGIVFEPRTVVVALCVGMLVTLVASLVPALRATRVTPMAALLEAELPEARKRGRALPVITVILAAGGLALLLIGLFGGGSAGDGGRHDGRRRGRDPVRGLALQPQAGEAAGGADRQADRAPARDARPAGARERDPQARPHGGHRGRADDRRGAGHVRDRVRLRASPARWPTRSRRASRPTWSRRTATASRRSPPSCRIGSPASAGSTRSAPSAA